MKRSLPPFRRVPLAPLSLRVRAGGGVFLLLALGLAACSDGGPSGSDAATDGDAPSRNEGGGARLAFQSAMNWLSSGHPDKARGDLERALEVDPDLAEAHFELGKLLVRQSYVVVGSGARDRATLESGIGHLKRALERKPQEADYAYWIGRAYHIGEELDSALEYLDRAVELDPGHGLAYKRKGLVLLDQGNLEGALAAFQEALPLLPEDGGLRFQYGSTLENLDRPDEALAAYEEAVRIDRTLPAPYGRLANLRQRAGDTEGAQRAQHDFRIWKRFERDLNAARKRVQKNPDDPEALTQLAEQYFAAGKWAEALEWFSQVLRLRPRDPAVHLYCGLCRRNLGELSFAVQHLEEASFLAPDSLEPRIELIRTCHLADKIERRDELIAEVAEEGASDVNANRELGKLLAELGLKDRARPLLERAVELAPDDVAARLALAAFLVDRGEETAARTHLEHALSVEPDNAEVKAALDRLGGSERG